MGLEGGIGDSVFRSHSGQYIILSSRCWPSRRLSGEMRGVSGEMSGVLTAGAAWMGVAFSAGGGGADSESRHSFM